RKRHVPLQPRSENCDAPHDQFPPRKSKSSNAEDGLPCYTASAFVNTNQNFVNLEDEELEHCQRIQELHFLAGRLSLDPIEEAEG
ncbi:hypothetical protein ScalyP_jg11075, partial [Parmales sp. scaly parma]